MPWQGTAHYTAGTVHTAVAVAVTRGRRTVCLPAWRDICLSVWRGICLSVWRGICLSVWREVDTARVPALEQHGLVTREARVVAPAVGSRVARKVVLACSK